MMKLDSKKFAFICLCALAVSSIGAQQFDNVVHSKGETFRGPSLPNYNNYEQVYTQSFVYQQPYVQDQPYVGPPVNAPPGFIQQIPVIQGGQTLDSRFMGDDPSVYVQNTLTTREPPPKVKQTTDLPPPPSFDTRFDNYTSRKIMWDRELSESTEVFSLGLFAYLEFLSQNQNIMISPFSIHSLLVIIAEGANGRTFDELNKVLGLKSKQRARDFHQYITTALRRVSSDVTLSQFSALVGDANRPVDREYEDVVEKVFDVEYIPVNFREVEKTLRDVNSEIARKTNNQITEALTRDEIYKAQLILLSGVHFQGSWKHVFNTSQTERKPFHDKDGNKIGEVNMMFNRGPFAYTAIQDIGAYILELPYAQDFPGNSANNADKKDNDRISMILLLPKKGQDLFTTIDLVNRFGMDRLFKELKKVKEEYEDDEVEIYLPRFETVTSLNLVEALQYMGINDLFEQATADLSKINSNYFVSSILHKSKIHVDEKGTEASAISTSVFQNKATPPVFNANRPFVYFIVDKATRLILFAGAYKTPTIF